MGMPVRTCSGFTLPELVATLVIIGIMAVVVVPRFASRSEFDVFGYSEQIRSALRLAQKSAVAKRRQVCVVVSANTLTLRVATSFGGPCDLALNAPASTDAVVQTAPAGVSISDAAFSFDALGRPSAAQAIDVAAGASTLRIRIEAETGYVH